MDDPLLEHIARLFDIPPDLMSVWQREGQMKRLHRLLWRAYIVKTARAFEGEVAKSFGLVPSEVTTTFNTTTQSPTQIL